MAAYRRVYDSRHLQADCQEPGWASEPYSRQPSMGYLYLFYVQRSDSGTGGVELLEQSEVAGDVWSGYARRHGQCCLSVCLWLVIASGYKVENLTWGNSIFSAGP